jgi:signal transduction histidine kinase
MEKEIPRDLYVFGERQYISLIVQNLLENAWKYNRPEGVLRVTARKVNGEIVLMIGNTGRTIPVLEHQRVFERFHRDGAGSSVAGHGVGLNLARELTRLHGGELRLVRSDDDWTEFEVRLPSANPLVREHSTVA